MEQKQFMTGDAFDGIATFYLNARKNIEEGGDRAAVKVYYAAEEQLQDAFSILAERIVSVFSRVDWNKVWKKDDVIESMVECAWAKADKFNPAKGRAFNFYTTVMLCQIRQLYRAMKRSSSRKGN